MQKGLLMKADGTRSGKNTTADVQIRTPKEGLRIGVVQRRRPRQPKITYRSIRKVDGGRVREELSKGSSYIDSSANWTNLESNMAGCESAPSILELSGITDVSLCQKVGLS